MNNIDDNDQAAIDTRWAEEAEARLDAYYSGKIAGMSISKVFEVIDEIVD